MMEITAREEAIGDMAYAINLGQTAFHQHWLQWRGATVLAGSYDAEYAMVVMEIYEKHNTGECLLK